MGETCACGNHARWLAIPYCMACGLPFPPPTEGETWRLFRAVLVVARPASETT